VEIGRPPTKEVLVTESITERRSPYNTARSGITSPRVPDTSIAAFESLDPEIKARQERQVFEFIKSNNGATGYEVVLGLRLLPQSASPAITKLRKSGHLVDTGERRPTSTGRNAIVWGVAQ
jgi:hypothetical protein